MGTSVIPYEKNDTTHNKYFYYMSILPVIIITYLHLIYNIIMVSTITKLLYKFIRVIQDDFQKYIDKKSQKIIENVLECSKAYIVNRCNSSVPMMEKYCLELRMCMEQDITYIIKSKESAEILAEILNNFFEHLSTRTLISFLVLFVGVVTLINIALYWSNTLLKKHTF